MSFFEEIKHTYGQHSVKILKDISKINTKLATQNNRRIFLLRCKHLEVTPTFLKINTSHLDFTGTYLERKLNNIILKTQKNILNLSLKQTTQNIVNLNKLINQKKEYVGQFLPINIASKFYNLENKKYQSLHSKIKLKQQIKLKNLLKKHTEINTTNDITSQWIENISDTLIPNEISKVLSFGPNFAVDITNEQDLPVTEYIAAIESVTHDKPDDEKDAIRAEVTNIITNHKTKLKHKNIKVNRLQKNIQKHLYRTKKFIKDNPQITVLKPDKSNKTVVMNTTEYDEKMENLLNDINTYKKINSDPTNIYQKKNNAFIKKLLNVKQITDKEAKMLTINNSVPPKIYGLPKLHKQNTPLRPIVSCIQSPLFNLSKYLANCLANITGKNNYFIKDSFEFKTFIDSIHIPLNYKLLSLDVTSLYTNIPKELVRIVISEKWNVLQNHTSISKQNFLDAIELTLNTNYFQFKNHFYKQIDGCAMGSPISSVIAQLVMEFLEEQVIQGLNFNVLFFKRFVDDCLLAVQEEKINEILHKFNNFHKKLQFTSEVENDGKINFLDLTLIRRHDKILTKWYTKPTWSGRYLNYYSNHAMSQKISVIVGLTDRAIKLTSPELRPDTLEKVKTILIQNDFKEKDINRTIKKRVYKHYNNLTSNNNKNKPNHEKFLPLPYTKELSEKLKWALKKHNITVCHKTQNKLNSVFTNLKSHVPKMNQSNVVYSIPCNDCPKKYIGMTCQLLKNRLNGHKYTKNASTALSKHEAECKHNFNFNDTKILCRDQNYARLQIREMIEIKKDMNSVNDRTDVRGVSHIYTNLIKN